MSRRNHAPCLAAAATLLVTLAAVLPTCGAAQTNAATRTPTPSGADLISLPDLPKTVTRESKRIPGATMLTLKEGAGVLIVIVPDATSDMRTERARKVAALQFLKSATDSFVREQNMTVVASRLPQDPSLPLDGSFVGDVDLRKPDGTLRLTRYRMIYQSDRSVGMQITADSRAEFEALAALAAKITFNE